MDKIKPILKQKFWILFGVGLLTPFIAWWMTTGKLQAEIETRRAAVETAAASAKKGGDAPNHTWTEQVSKLNDVSQSKLTDASVNLWRGQERLMFWHPRMQQFTRSLRYREPLPGKDGRTAQFVYRDSYNDQLWDVVTKVDPLMGGKGQIKINPATIHHINTEMWTIQPPTWDDMWDAQEDMWLLTDLLQSIKNVNGDASIADAPIRELTELKLQGGSRSSGGAAAPAAGGYGGEAGYEDYMSGGEGGFGGFGGGQGGSMGGGGQGQQLPPVDFKIEDELGSAVDASAAPAAGSSEYGGGMPGFGQAASMKLKRYVDDDDAQPYRTRGFKISVVMLDDNLPDLLAELTQSRWPVEIVRVQRQDRFQDDVTSAMAGGNQGMAGGAYDSFGGGETYGNDQGGEGMPMGGSAYPMGGTEGFGGAGPGVSAALAGKMKVTQDDTQLIQAALSDRNLVTAVIVGTMTLFKQPEAERQLVESRTAAAAAIDDAAGNVPPAAGDAGSLPSGSTVTPPTNGLDPSTATPVDGVIPVPADGLTEPAATVPSEAEPDTAPGNTSPEPAAAEPNVGF